MITLREAIKVVLNRDTIYRHDSSLRILCTEFPLGWVFGYEDVKGVIPPGLPAFFVNKEDGTIKGVAAPCDADYDLKESRRLFNGKSKTVDISKLLKDTKTLPKSADA